MIWPFGEENKGFMVINNKPVEQISFDLGISYIDLVGTKINPEVFKFVPEQLAQKYRLVSFALYKGQVHIAVENPLSIDTIEVLEEIKKQRHISIEVFISSKESIDHVLKLYREAREEEQKIKQEMIIGKEAERAIQEAIEKNKDKVNVEKPKILKANTFKDSLPKNDVKIKEIDYREKERKGKDNIIQRNDEKNIKNNIEDNKVFIKPKIKEDRQAEEKEFNFSNFVEQAISSEAKKIFLEREDNGGKIWYKSSDIKIINSLEEKKVKEILLKMALLTEIDFSNKMNQKGYICYLSKDKKINLEIIKLEGKKGEITIEIPAKKENLDTLDSLGIEGLNASKIISATQKDQGLILVTGYEGSGKTTTVYSLIKLIREQGKSIETLEKPIDCLIAGTNQTQIDPENGVTYSSGLRKILTNKPDCIVISDARDTESINKAMDISLSGKIVVLTLNAKNIFDAINKLSFIGIDIKKLFSALSIIISQRLILRLCDSCKQELSVDEKAEKTIKDVLEGLPSSQKQTNINIKTYSAFHCSKCGNTGYSGRIGNFEVLSVDNHIKSLIAENIPLDEFEETVIDERLMVTLKQDGFLKALEGVTSLEEINRVIKQG